MKKPSLLFAILAIAISCEESNRSLSPEVLMDDPAFISIMEIHSVQLQKFDVVSGKSAKEKQAFHEGLNQLLNSRTGDEKVVSYLGYDQIEFEELNKKLFNTYQHLLKKYPALSNFDGSNDLYRLTVKFYLEERSQDALTNKISSNGRSKVEATGCEGGLTCFRQATDCDQQAEEDFAVASASCTALGWFPTGWAVCQGSAFLVYSADKLDCAYKLDVCCNLGTSTNPV